MNTAENVLNKPTNLIRGMLLDKSSDWHWEKKSSGLASQGKTLVMAELCRRPNGFLCPLSAMQGTLFSPLELWGPWLSRCPIASPWELYRASGGTHWFSFSSSLKDSSIFPGFLRYFGSPMTAGVYPKARLCSVIFHCFLPSRAALLFQSLGFAKVWHSHLPKFWTYTQVEICNLTYSTAFNECCGIYKWKENMHDKEQKTFLY